MIELSEFYRNEISRILNEIIPDCEVRIFGSRVNGKPHTYSDVDLAVVGQTKLDKQTISRLQEAFAISDLPIMVDVLDWNAISEDFRKWIGNQYEVIQKPQTN